MLDLKYYFFIFAQEQEARIDLLRQKAKSKSSELPGTSSATLCNDDQQSIQKHVNFFEALEEGRDAPKKPNVEHEKEKKDEQEKYEKQIGYLTYLGQDTNEATGKRDWYEMPPDRDKKDDDDTEIGLKFKTYHDPLNVMKKYMSIEESKKDKSADSKTKRLLTGYEPIMNKVIDINKELEIHRKLKKELKRKHKKEKKSKKKKSKKKSSRKKKRSSSSKSCSEPNSDSDQETILLKQKRLEILRQERIKREQEERLKSQQLLAKIYGDPNPKPKEPIQQASAPQMKRKYNSQFNPELARQNYDDRY